MKLFKNQIFTRFKKIAFSPQKGFTLTEVLVAVVVLGAIGVILSDTLSRSFKSSDKIELLGNVKQNGQNAMNTLDQKIRSASNVVCTGDFPTPSYPNTTIVVEKENIFTRFRIMSETARGSGNGYIVQDYPTISDPTYPPLRASLCASTVPTAAELASMSLMNYDNKTGVSVQDGNFTLIKNPNDPQGKDSVVIQFTLGPAVQAGSGAENQIENGRVPFKTTVQLR